MQTPCCARGEIGCLTALDQDGYSTARSANDRVSRRSPWRLWCRADLPGSGDRIDTSVGSVGDSYDNALAESIIGLFKTECIRTTVFHPGPYRTIAEVEYATAGWVDWYNNRRLHSTLEMMTPVEYEQAHYAALKPEPQPV